MTAETTRSADPLGPTSAGPAPLMPRGRASAERVEAWMRGSVTRAFRKRQQIGLDELADLATAALGERPRLEHLLLAAEAVGASTYTHTATGETFVRLRLLP